DPAVGLMHLRLRVKRVCQQTLAAIVERKAGFVAGRFNAQHQHAPEYTSRWVCIACRAAMVLLYYLAVRRLDQRIRAPCPVFVFAKMSPSKWRCGVSSARSKRRDCSPSCERESFMKNPLLSASASSPP